MFTLLGHTLGTPNHSVTEALELFARCGLDGAEVIWQDDYRAGLAESDQSGLQAVRRRARELRLVVGCLTPYMTGINSLDADSRERDIGRFVACIRAAEALDCPRVRVYAGRWTADSATSGTRAESWARLVESLRRLGDVAARHGVMLCVENHFNTMTESARETALLAQEVDSPAVGILYDQANLTFTYRESFDEAIRVQSPWIRHVHVKDVELLDGGRDFRASDVYRVDPADRRHRSRIVGDGILDWRTILGGLTRIGYDGALSLEYEYRWHPEDLPEPDVGFRISAERTRAILDSIGASAEAHGTRQP